MLRHTDRTLLSPLSKKRKRIHVVMMVKYDKALEEARRRTPRSDLGFFLPFTPPTPPPLPPSISRCSLGEGIENSLPPPPLTLLLPSCSSVEAAGMAIAASSMPRDVSARCCCGSPAGDAAADTRSWFALVVVRCRSLFRLFAGHSFPPWYLESSIFSLNRFVYTLSQGTESPNI